MQNRGYNSDYLVKLKDNNDIVSVVSKYVHLKDKGKLFWGCCPFHHEKTPSFSVNSLEQYYHCFGCGESGDVIEFVKKIESVDFMTAVKILAENANMDLPEYAFDENLIKQKKLKDQILQALQLANEFYKSCLNKSELALNYIKKRGLSEHVVNKFELGFSPDYNSLVNFLKSKNISADILKQAGLVNENSFGKIYDTMYERLTFPIKDSLNNVIAFSSRILQDNPDFAKYKNTTQTMVFDKSNVVFGIQFLKKLKLDGKLNEIIIVEGQMDVISMHSAGFTNAVACMGTALTNLHAKQLKRFCNKIILCFDGDGAGVKATIKAIDILKQEDLDVYVVSLPDGLDPDEYIKKYSVDKMQLLVENAISMYDYLILNASKMYDLTDNLQLSKFVKTCLNYIKEIQSESEREPYIRQISKFSKIPIEVLKRDLSQIISPGEKIITKENFRPSVLTDNVFKSQLFIIASLLHKKPYATFIEMSEFNSFTLEYVYSYLKDCIQKNKAPIISAIFDENVQKDEIFEQIINYAFNDDTTDEKYFKDCVKTLELNKLIKEQAVYTSLMTDARTLEDRKKYAIKLQQITKEISQKKLEDKNWLTKNMQMSLKNF